MLSDRITLLFSLLQCANTDIARFAGCSSGNISKLKTGHRTPKSSSRSIAALTAGIYGYADYENMLAMLAELCLSEDTTREKLIPALVAWLYETEDVTLSPHSVTPRSKQALAQRRQSFGEKLDRAMTLLALSNSRLAALLNVDDSLISRYRRGIYSPHRNASLSEKLCSILLSRARRSGQTKALAEMCSVSEAELNLDALAAWLYQSTPEEDNSTMAQLLLSLDHFTPGQGLPAARPELPEVPIVSRYFGTEGLRSAVVRFLSDAAREGGELLLYSDEPMDWMREDRDYFALWASLMVACVKSGVRIKIIHNVDREGEEIIDAIKGWLPLYISGLIEPYVFRKESNARFCCTMFLRTDGACIHGFFPVGSGDKRWYDYITDKDRLDLLYQQYSMMISTATPLLKTYTAAMSNAFRELCGDSPWTGASLLTDLPVVTMPEDLLARMLVRAEIDENKTTELLSLYRDMRDCFNRNMKMSDVNMILCPSGKEAAQSRRVNFSLDLLDLALEYTPEEYSEHVDAVMKLVEQEKNFHLTLLPDAPFRDIQIVTLGDALAVLRCREPCAAFVFLNPMLTESVSDYLGALIEQFSEDRHATAEALEKLKTPDTSQAE